MNLQKAKSILKIQENQCNFRDGLLAKPFIVEEIKKEEEVPEVPKPSEERVQEVL